MQGVVLMALLGWSIDLTPSGGGTTTVSGLTSVTTASQLQTAMQAVSGFGSVSVNVLGSGALQVDVSYVSSGASATVHGEPLGNTAGTVAFVSNNSNNFTVNGDDGGTNPTMFGSNPNDAVVGTVTGGGSGASAPSTCTGFSGATGAAAPTFQNALACLFDWIGGYGLIAVLVSIIVHLLVIVWGLRSGVMLIWKLYRKGAGALGRS